MTSTGAWSSNEIQRLDYMTGYQDICPNNGCRAACAIFLYLLFFLLCSTVLSNHYFSVTYHVCFWQTSIQLDTYQIQCDLTLKQQSHYFQSLFYFLMLFTINVIFLHGISPIQWIFSQHCGYWWPGALTNNNSTSAATLLCTHAFPAVYGLVKLTNWWFWARKT